MTRALVLAAHPCAESFGQALHGAVVSSLRGRGWEVDDCDPCAEGFQPVLTAAERRGHHDTGANEGPVADHVARLRSAQALVFPVWNFGFPAILKGCFDRVFLPGVSFRLEQGRLRPALTHVRRLAAVATHGGTRLCAVLAGDPPRHVVKRAIRYVCRPERMRYLALYDMNRATAADRAAFLARVRSEMEVL